MPVMQRDQVYEIRNVLVVDKYRGILGTMDDYTVDDADCRLIEVCIRVPVSFFEPVKLIVDVPEGLTQDHAVGETESIEIPIELEVPKDKQEVVVKVEERLKDGRGRGLISLIRRKLFES